MTSYTPDEIELAMQRCLDDPLNLIPGDMEKLVAYLRHAKVLADSGQRTKKHNKVNLDQKISLDDIGLKPKMEKGGSGLRRL
jgi:hypothetical protein